MTDKQLDQRAERLKKQTISKDKAIARHLDNVRADIVKKEFLKHKRFLGDIK